MKKLISVIICALILISSGAFSINSFAARTYSTWEEAYKDYIENYLFKDDVIQYKGAQYALKDLDNDGVPELVVGDGHEGGTYSHGYVYSFYNGKVFLLGSMTNYGWTFCAHSIEKVEYPGLYTFVWERGSQLAPEDMVFNWTYYKIVGKNENKKLESVLVARFLDHDFTTGNGGVEYLETRDISLLDAINNHSGNFFLYNEEEYNNIGWAQFLMLTGNSLNYYNDIAIMSAYLCEAANDKWSDNVKAKYTEYGFKNIVSDNYGAVPIGPFEIATGSAAYTFGYKTLYYDRSVVLAITLRGTTSIAEAIGDNQKGDLQPFLTEQIYDNIFDYEEEVWSALKNYINSYSEIKNADNLSILVTGHSLGGAAANTIAARLNYGIKNGTISWLKNAKKESVYAYTFGAIKVFFEEGDNVTPNINKGYENIHNIYNYYDTYGPNGSESGYEVGSIYDKYGHTELFKKFYDESNDKYANHGIANYRDALNNHLVTCKGKDDEINTDNNSSFMSRLVTGANRVFNAIKDFGKAFIDNMGNSVETVAVVVVNGFEKVATAVGDFFSWLIGG